MDIDRFCKNLIPTSSPEIFTKGQEFNDSGLYSEIIFGPLETLERKTRFSYIDLYSKIIHPSAFKILKQLDRKIEAFISGQENFILNSEKRLEVNKDGFTGMTKFIEIFPKINFRGDSEIRNKYIDLIKKSYQEDGLRTISLERSNDGNGIHNI